MESFPTGTGRSQGPQRPAPAEAADGTVGMLGTGAPTGAMAGLSAPAPVRPRAGLGRAGRPRTSPRGRAEARGHAHSDTASPPGPAPQPRSRPADNGRFSRTLDRWDVAIAGGLALVAMLVVFIFRSALVPTDPWHYVQGAITFPEGTWRPEGLSRWGYLLPLVPFARLWGDSTATYYVLPLLCTGALAGLLYLLGARHVSRLAGALGTVLALATPLVFVNLSRGYTDLMATTLCGAALLVAVLTRDLAAKRRPDEWGREVPALLIACGFLLGWSAEVRETAVFVYPVVGWVLWGVGPVRRLAQYVVPPIVGWLLLDLLLLQLIYGDPLLKIRWVLGADIAHSEVSSDAVYVGHSRWWYATVLVRSLWELTGGPALVACLFVGIAGGFLMRAQLGRIWAWGMLALVPLWLQGGVLDPTAPSVRLDVARYWLAFLAPLMLCAAGVMVIAVSRARDWGRWVSGGVSALLCVGLLVPSAAFMATYSGFYPNGGDAMSHLRDELTEHPLAPNARIWADWGTQRVLPAYQNGPFGAERWSAASFRSLNRLLGPEAGTPPQAGDYVVVYSDTERTCWHCRRALKPVEAAYGPFPAAGWELLYTSPTQNLRLYRLGATVVWPKAHSQESGDEESEDADESEPGP